MPLDVCMLTAGTSLIMCRSQTLQNGEILIIVATVIFVTSFVTATHRFPVNVLVGKEVHLRDTYLQLNESRSDKPEIANMKGVIQDADVCWVVSSKFGGTTQWCTCTCTSAWIFLIPIAHQALQQQWTRKALKRRSGCKMCQCDLVLNLATKVGIV